jgi:hypothetical protein
VSWVGKENILYNDTAVSSFFMSNDVNDWREMNQRRKGMA